MGSPGQEVGGVEEGREQSRHAPLHQRVVAGRSPRRGLQLDRLAAGLEQQSAVERRCSSSLGEVVDEVGRSGSRTFGSQSRRLAVGACPASGHQPPLSAWWTLIEAISRAGDDHDSLSIGCPSGRGHENGSMPMLAGLPEQRRCAGVVVLVGWAASRMTPRARYVATTSSPGSRTLSPADRSNAREATSARSTGTIAVSCSR